MDSESKAHSFQMAELQSERIRVRALLCLFASLLVLILIRGGLSLAEGHGGGSWPFALLLAAFTAYEAAWLGLVTRAMRFDKQFSKATWTGNIFIESLLPTIALYLQMYTSFIGPRRALTSPVALTYFLLIILSTLHLSPLLSRMSGLFSAIGYAVVSMCVFLLFPEVAAGEKLLVYGTSFSYSAFLLLGGFAAGAVAEQIRLHVVAALREFESRAKVAELEHDLDLARSIQQGFFPKVPPRIHGFDIAGWNKPADVTGGDYFDWQQLADGSIAFTVADVTGHGIGPALGMAACRSYARAILTSQTDLRSFLCRLNELLCEDLPPGRFVTLVTGLLNPPEATMQFISAGHGPLLFYSAETDGFRCHDAQGPPLGIFPRFGYGDPQLLKLAPGDILVLVTDGFLEWVNAVNEDFGLSRLKDVIRKHQHMPAAGIISQLYSAVLSFAGSSPQLDDLTALVLKRVC